MKSLLAALSRSRSPDDIQNAIASLSQHVAAKFSNESDEDGWQHLYPVVKALLAKLGSCEAISDGKAVAEQLLDLVDTCFSCCRRLSNEDSYLVLLYSYVNKLKVASKLPEALKYGQHLLSCLTSTGPSPVGYSSSLQSQTQQDLVFGTSLNVLMCLCKLGKNILGQLSIVNTAAQCLLAFDWTVGGKGRAHHKDVLCEYLVQLVTAAGREAASLSSIHGADMLTAELVMLLKHLYVATNMSSKPGLLQQVVIKSAAALPDLLKHCSIIALLHAANQHDSNCAALALAATAVASSIQAVVQSICTRTKGAAACAAGLLQTTDQGGIDRDMHRMLGLLCCCCGSTAPGRELIGIVAAMITTSRQSASNTAAAELAVSRDEHLIDRVTEQISSMSLSQPATKSRSRRAGRLPKFAGDNGTAISSESMHPHAQGQSSGAPHVQQSQQLQSAEELRLKLTIGCLQQVQECCLPGPEIAVPLAVLLCHITSTITAAPSMQQTSTSVPWGVVAKAVVLSATRLQQLECESCSSSSRNSSAVEHQEASSLCTALTQQWCAAVKDLVYLSIRSQSASSSSSDCLSNDELQWLSWQLWSVALGKQFANSCPSSSCGTSTGDSWYNAELLLLSWHCSCAQLQLEAVHNDKAEVGSSKQPTTASAAVPTVLTMLLQQAQAYLSFLWRTLTSGDVDSEASSTLRSAAAPDAAPAPSALVQLVSSAEHVMMQSVLAAAKHLTGTQAHAGSAVQLLPRLSKLLKAYSKLRCRLKAEDRHGSSSSSADTTNMNGTRRTGQCSSISGRQPVHTGNQVNSFASPLPSVAHMMHKQQQQACTCSSGGAHHAVPPHLLAWLECKVLLGLSGDTRLPPGSAAAAVDDLLTELSTCTSPDGMGAAAASILIRGMALACSPTSSPPQRKDNGSTSFMIGNACVDSTQQQAAIAALDTACQQWLAMLTCHASCGDDAAVPAKKGTGNKGRAKAASSRTKSKAQATPDTVSSHTTVSLGAQALITSVGPAAAAQVLVPAALSHGLLAVLMAGNALSRQASSCTAAAAESTGHETAAQAGCNQTFDACNSSSAGHGDIATARTDQWLLVQQHLHTSACLFQALVDSLGPDIGCCVDLSFFITEAASVAVQGWHIAGLQGWLGCQRAFADTVSAIAALQPGQQMQHIQKLLSVVNAMPWLAVVVAPQLHVPQPPIQGSSSSPCKQERPAASTLIGRAKQAVSRSATSVKASTATVLCSCCMQTQHQTLAAAKQSNQQLYDSTGLLASDAAVLQHAQLLLASCQAATAAGDAAAALLDAEAAVEISRLVIAASNNSDSRNRFVELSSGLLWHAVGLYMSGLWLMSEVLEASGNPADALRALKELLKLSTSCNCSYVAALAHSRVGSISLKAAEYDKANAAAADAKLCLLAFQQSQAAADLHLQHEGPSALLHAYAAALVAQAKAGCKTAGLQHQAAHEQLVRAVGLINDQLVVADQRLPQQQVCMLSWRAVGLRAQLQLQWGHSLLLTEGIAAATEQLLQASSTLATASTCELCKSSAWPLEQAVLQLHLLAWSPPPLPARPAKGQGLQLVGFSSSTTHSNLQAEFADAAADTSVGKGQEYVMAGSDAAAASQRSGRGSRRQTASRSRTATKSSSSSSGKSADLGQAGQKQHCSAPDVAVGTWLVHVLQILPAFAQQPLLLRDACGLLSSVLQAQGAVHSAALMLQLSLGASAAQQHLLAVTSKLARSQQQSQLVQNIEEAAAGSSNVAGTPSLGVLWQQLQQQLDLQPLLQDLALVAKQTALQFDTAADVQVQLLKQLNVVAESWLQDQLAGLLPGTAACSVTASTALTAATTASVQGADGAWYPLFGPAAAALMQSAGHAANGVLICRMMQRETSAPASSGAQCCPLPLLVQLTPPEMPNQQQHNMSIHSVLDELSSILADSTANMQANTELTTAVQKTNWWKQRLALDARMAALLQQLDLEWLGPWRCLLMQPSSQQMEAAAMAAAETYVAEYFDFVFEDLPKQLLMQLVATLLIHLDSTSTTEQQRALRELCQLTQHRVDGLHLSKLLAGLTDAHAVVAAAAVIRQEVTSNNSCSGSSSRSSSSTEQSSSSNSGMEAALDAVPDAPVAAEYKTPAAPKARSRLSRLQTSASARKPQSRLKLMQQSDHDGSDAAVTGVDGIMSSFATRLQADTDADHRAAGTNASRTALAAVQRTPAAAGNKTRQGGRRVRFAAETQDENAAPAVNMSVADEGPEQLVVPPSLARHAVRRSRLVNADLVTASNSGQSRTGTSTSLSTPVASTLVALSESPPGSSNSGPDLAGGYRSTTGKDHSTARTSALTAADTGKQQQQSKRALWVPSVLLLLDGQLQQLPWEALEGLKRQDMYRCPNLVLAVASSMRHQATQQNSHNNPAYSSAGDSKPLVPSMHNLEPLHLSQGFFVLDPDGDLQGTRSTFESWLKQLGLQGVSGNRPSPSRLISDLLSHDLFLYFGHGGGEQYVPLSALKRLDRCAAGLLMGCSSGRLKQMGMYEPSGAISGYMLAGCPTAVANLWDVTDRDIDRFAQSVLQHWSNNDNSFASGTHGGQDSNANHGLDPRAHNDWSVEGVVSIPAAVVSSRSACRLPHLIGSAAVCYGLPGFIQTEFS